MKPNATVCNIEISVSFCKQLIAFRSYKQDKKSRLIKRKYPITRRETPNQQTLELLHEAGPSKEGLRTNRYDPFCSRNRALEQNLRNTNCIERASLVPFHRQTFSYPTFFRQTIVTQTDTTKDKEETSLTASVSAHQRRSLLSFHSFEAERSLLLG